MGVKNWNRQRMPKRIKWDKEAQKWWNGPRMPKRIKWDKGVRKRWNGLRMPKRIKWDKRARKQWNEPRKPETAYYKPNDSTRLLEFSKRKAYSRPKRGPTGTSQIIAYKQSTEIIELKRGKVFNKLAFGWQQQNHHPHEEKLFGYPWRVMNLQKEREWFA